MVNATIRNLLCNERIMLIVIVLNTVFMFLGGFWPNELWPDLFDAGFTVIFVLEAVAKISEHGWFAYWQRGWNRFDFIILLIALPSLASIFVDNVVDTNAIFALRAFRLFKSFKMLHFIPNIQRLLNGLKLAFKASFLVLIAFVVLLLISSILSSAIFCKVAPEYFSNPAISIYSIFRLFSIEGWYELPDAIAHNSTPFWGIFARCYFSVLMFLGGIVGLSLVNSIFVDAMAGDNNDEVLSKLNSIEEQLRNLSRKK